MRMMTMLAPVAALAMLATPALAAAETARHVIISSPDQRISVRVGINDEGRPVYAVARDKKTLIGEGQLGFLLTDAPSMHRNFAIAGSGISTSDETWEQPWGEWRRVRNHYNELKVRLKETTALGREMIIAVRVFNTGVGLRYEFPDQPNLKTIRINEELTQFALPAKSTAWWSTAFESNREEYLYNESPVAEVGTSMTPMTVKTPSGTLIALHEAALVNYPGMNLSKVQGGLFKAALTPGNGGPKAVVDAPFTTPWRVMLIADDAAGLYHANAQILNLNEPNRLGDVRWVRPRKYMGIWWGMHLDTQSWASGAKHGATTAYAKRMIDYAAKHGFSGLLIEGWNKGWDGDWFANGQDFSFTQSYPDFDLPSVTAYGRKKGVTLIGHHETSANAAHYESQMEDAFRLYQKHGVDTVKTGYVSDFGGFRTRNPDGSISFGWHEGQAAVNHHLKVVQTAAKYRIAVNPHEPVKDTGLRRTYPNWISREGQRGMEYNAWAVPKNPPSYDTGMVFTRMLGGPFDFTPGIVSLRGRGDTPLPSTLARQLAYYVVIYSPIQMAADLPEHYDAHPQAFQFIKDVAVDWEDTRVLNGEVGRYVTIARKERRADGKPGHWFLGAITDEAARTLTVPLSFLEPGKYRAEIYRDGTDAHYLKNQFAFAKETRTVTAGDTLTINLAAGGGQAIRFVRLN